MADDLEIKIGASVENLKKALKEAGYEVKKFSEKTTDAVKENQSLGKSSTISASGLRNLSAAAKGGASSLGDVAEAGLDVVDEMSNMSSAAGSLSGAITAGVVVALLTAAITLTKYAFRLSDSAKQTRALLDATKKLIGSAQVEISTYNSLLSIAKDETRSKEDRVRALKKVNEQSGKYIGNLDLESINSEKAAGLTDKYSDALLQNAKIKGLQGRLSDLYAKQFDIQNRSLEENVTWLGKAWQSAKAFGLNQGALGASLNIVTRGLKNQQTELQGVNDEITNLSKKITGLISEDVSLQGVFTNPKKQEKELEQIRNHSQNVISALMIGREEIKALPPIGAIVPTAKKLTEDEMRFIAHQGRVIEGLNTFNNEAGNIISNGLTNTFSGIGQAIGTALSEGGSILNNLGQVLLGALGGVLVSLGKMAVKVGVGILAVKKSLQTLNPFAAIGAGIALIAIGAAFSKGAKNLGNSMGSGGGSKGVSGGGSGGGSTPRSSTQSGGGGFSGGTVVFEIAGQKLVGVLSNTLERNRALGGSLSLTTP